MAVFVFKVRSWSWRDDPVVKSTCCSSGGPSFCLPRQFTTPYNSSPLGPEISEDICTQRANAHTKAQHRDTYLETNEFKT